MVFISRCRDFDSFGQYFASMPWLALPHELAAGELGERLSLKYGVKSIPSLVLLDGEDGSVITTDGRSKIPADKAGVGFPWRGAGKNLARSFVPGPVRRAVGGLLNRVRLRFINLLRACLFMKPIPA